MKSKYIINLVFIFCVAVILFPMTYALANMQNPLLDLDITDYTGTINNYRMQLEFKKPPVSAKPESSQTVLDKTGLHDVLGYNVYYRNSSKKESYKDPLEDIKKTDAEISTVLEVGVTKNFKLQNGSIYLFKVVPYHIHKNAGNNGVALPDTSATMDLSGGRENPEVAYLTDINVMAQGSGNKLVITWDNPTVDGIDVFYGYRIYYTPLTDPIVPIPDSAKTKDVSLKDASLVRSSNGKVEYSFVDSDFKLGDRYAVKVEPLVTESTLLRDSIKTINVAGKQYKIAYPTRSREYRTNDTYIKPSLDVKDHSLDEVKVFWEKPFTGINNVNKIEVFESDYEDFTLETLIDTLVGNNAVNINFSIRAKPTKIKYYRIKIYYNNGGKEDVIVSENAIYDPGFTEFSPYSPNVLKIEDNRVKPFKLDVIWEGFLRDPYNQSEKKDPIYDKFVDKDITYDIFITDDVNNFDDPVLRAFPIKTVEAGLLDTIMMDGVNGAKLLGYKDSFTEYYSKKTGGYEKKPFEENKVYYVKIIATRNTTGELSKPAFGSHYILPIGDINNRPIMMSKPPLRIKKDEKGIDEITLDSITIQWDKFWYEVYDENTKQWHPKAGVDSSGNLLFDKAADSLERIDNTKIVYFNDPKYLGAGGLDLLKQDLAALGANPSVVNSLSVRLQELKDNAEYEIIVLPFKQMEAEGGYDAYLEKILLEENAGMWKKITADGDKMHPHHVITGLNSNETYITFFRPYYEDANGKKTAYLPNFVVGTTLKPMGDLDITPVVSNIEVVEVSDTTATVKFNFIEGLSYDLYIADELSKYPSGGLQYKWADIKEKLTFKTIGGKNYAFFTFDNLFPETTYQAWMQSFIDNKGKINYSNMSNPVEFKTKDIITPQPPRGLGFASKASLAKYNKENGKDFVAQSKDYMVIEWLKDPKDTRVLEDIKTKLDSWLNVPSITHAYMAKFDKLDANRKYYVRAKTMLTMSKDKDGTVIRTYNYKVQIATNEDFVDFMEVVIPPIDSKLKEDKYVKTRESDWSQAVILNSGKTDTEYDGDKNPDMYPLPMDDYEITFDSNTNTLKYRFRSNKVDAQGNKDNMVDNRFVNKLISQNPYNYELELTKYFDHTIKNREVELPYTIFEAFNQRKINFTINIDGTKFTIPYNSFQTDEVKAIKDLGQNSSIIFKVTDSPKNLPTLLPNSNFIKPESYVTEPRKLSIDVKTNSGTKTLKSLSKDMTIFLRLKNRNLVVDNNVSAVYTEPNLATWNTMESSFVNNLGGLNTKTNLLGTYSAIAKQMPTITNFDPNLNSSYNVFAKLNIKDMPNYDPQANINATQYNNLISAVAKNTNTFTINTPLAESDKKSLSKSKLLIDGNSVSRESAVHSLVKLYEVKTGTKITGYETEDISSVTGLSEEMKTSYKKAYKIGLIEDLTTKPKDNIPFGEVLYYLDFIMQSY